MNMKLTTPQSSPDGPLNAPGGSAAPDACPPALHPSTLGSTLRRPSREPSSPSSEKAPDTPFVACAGGSPLTVNPWPWIDQALASLTGFKARGLLVDYGHWSAHGFVHLWADVRRTDGSLEWYKDRQRLVLSTETFCSYDYACLHLYQRLVHHPAELEK